MPGKPFQSSLIPYQEEIAALRSRRPPVSYARIADLLQQKYGLTIQRAAIGKFVKSRSGGRKVYFFSREIAAKRPRLTTPASQSVDFRSHSPLPDSVNSKGQLPKPKFEFTYSERYSLKRLPKEEAAAIRKKLEAEGH